MKYQDWVDILPPPAPADTITWWAWLLISGSLLVLIFTFSTWYSSPRQVAKRKLRSLESLLADKHNYKNIPWQARNILKQAFSVNNLEQLESGNIKIWQSYLSSLSRMCFSRQTPARSELEQLLKDTRGWLNKAGRLHD